MFGCFLVEYFYNQIWLIFSIMSGVGFILLFSLADTLGKPLLQEIPEIEIERYQKIRLKDHIKQDKES